MECTLENDHLQQSSVEVVRDVTVGTHTWLVDSITNVVAHREFKFGDFQARNYGGELP